ncbi:MAG: CHASE domain-containing protein [Nitrospira sp.]|nr:CHASE domain-containing protein [Nitrospira sp.]
MAENPPTRGEILVHIASSTQTIGICAMPGLPNPHYVPRESQSDEPGARAPLAGVADQPNDPPLNEQTTPSFSISSGVMLAAAYIVLGKLGLMLAVPPGYASGIFPPAGLAIAATYLWGGSTLPWIVLGSLTLNFSVTATPLHTSAIVAALCIAAASALQAWIGRVVLHRAIGPQTSLETLEHIGGYLLAAPFICLIGASLSVASLATLQVIPSDQTRMAWMTWGLGDTLGMVSIFPIMLALFGTHDSRWKGRRILVASIMSTMLALVMLTYVGFTQIESARTAQGFHFQADRLAKTIQDHFDEQEFILTQLDMALSMSQREPVSREAFRALAKPALNRFPMLQAIEWVPEIPSHRRALFEASQRQSTPEFVITQRDETGTIVPVLDRPSYYPVTYLEPLLSNRKALGFDLGSSPARHAAILRAREAEGSIATEPVTLVQEEETQQGLLLIRRIQTGANAPGFVLTVLRIEKFIGMLLPEGNELAVSLADAEQGTLIYGTPPSTVHPPAFTGTLRFGGRQYQLSIIPSSAVIAGLPSWQSWSLLVGGLLGDGLLGAVLLLITGTTNQIRAQVEERTQQLALKSDLLQAVIDHVPMRVFWKDRSLRFLGCNPLFARDAGKSHPGELLGKTDHDLAWATEAERYQADDANIIETERPKIAFEEPQTTPSGRTTWVRTSKVPLKNQANQVIGVLGMYEDVSEQRAMEARVRESEERFTLAMQAASDGLWDWNIQTQVTYFSPQWKAMLGYADQELENSFVTWERLVDEDGRVWTMALINDCLCGRSNGFRTEFQMRHKDGHWVDVLSRAILVRTPNGEPLRMVGTHVDITERNAIARELEQAAQTMEQQNQALSVAHNQALAATEAKSAFLASMSHEIRTPLNAIIGMAELLKETSLSQDQADYVQRFSRAADHLMGLVSDILDLSKIEAGKLQLEQIPFNPRELMATVRDLLAVSAKSKQLTLDMHVQPNVPSTVIGDPTRLRQVLMNLVGNAIKFTEQGQVVVTVEVIADDRMRFAVSDTGIGIPSDKLSFIFERFTQGDTTTTRKFGGTGLGLSICQRLVSMMEGRLNVTSAVGVGSTFEFTLRLPSASETVTPRSNGHVQRETEPPARPSAPPLRILVVDDLEDNRAIVAHYLKQDAYVMDMADNGRMALEKFQTGSYDLVLMDVQMPIMDGLQATRAMRQWERTEHRAPTPILALTAHALEEEAKKSLDAGCTAHLTKPIKKQALLRAVADYATPRTEQAA